MELAVITAKQVAELLLMILAGAACCKAGMFKPKEKSVLANLLLYLVVPAMVLDSYMVEYDPATFHNLMLAFGLGALVLLVGLGVAFLASFKVQKDARAILWFACAFSNAGYMGFPLIKALFGGEGLLGELRKVDPERAARLHPADKKRIVRAMEVYVLTGKTITQPDAETRAVPPRYDAAKIALDFTDRQDLYDRIDRRVELMVRQGLFDEVRALLAAGVPADCTAMQAIGYKEAVAAVRGEASPQDAVAAIQLASRRYAKRQLTWLRRDQDLFWLRHEKTPDMDRACRLSTQFLSGRGIE